MKLFNVPKNSRITLTDDPQKREFNFSHIDGMYSYCTNDEGEVFHISAEADVEIIK